jgi:adenylate kinase family enzyme
MRIFIVGNINSGKTTLSKKLHMINNFKILSIDDFRIRYSDGTAEGEELAKRNFLYEIIRNDDAIIECTASNNIMMHLQSILPKNSCLVYKINTHLNVCLDRMNKKDFSKIPYPKYYPSISRSDEIKYAIGRIDSNIKYGMIENNFQEISKKIITIDCDYDFNEFKNPQLHEI